MALIDDYNKALRELEQGLNVQEMMKKANAIIRNSRLSDGDKVKELTDIGFSEKQALQIIAPDYMGRKGFPQYKLTSNNDRNKRLQDKVNSLRRQLDSQKQAEESGTTGEEFTFDGGTATANHDLDRYQIFFDEIPTSEMRTKLKGAGWNWSPSNKAWQRKITDNALWSMKNVLPGFSNTGGSEKTIDHTAEDLNISKIDMRDFSFVTFGAYQLGKYFKEQGLIDTHLPSIRFVVLDGSKVTASQKVKDYLHKMIPQAPVDKIDFSIYPKTYIAEAKDLFKKGMVIGDERLDKLIQSTYKELIISKEDFRTKMNEAIDEKLTEQQIVQNDPAKNVRQSQTLSKHGFTAERKTKSYSQGALKITKDGREIFYSLEVTPPNYQDGRQNPYFKTDPEVEDILDYLAAKETAARQMAEYYKRDWSDLLQLSGPDFAQMWEEFQKYQAVLNDEKLKDLPIEWHEYKGREYFYEPHFKEWHYNDEQFESEQAIHKRIDLDTLFANPSQKYEQAIPSKPDQLSTDYHFSKNKDDRHGPTQSAGELKRKYGSNSEQTKELFSTLFLGNDNHWYRLHEDKNGVWSWKADGMDQPIPQIIKDLPSSWRLNYFDPNDPSYDVEYSNDIYTIRVRGGGVDYNIQITKGDFIEDNVNIVDVDQANDYVRNFMKSHNEVQKTSEINLDPSSYKNPYELNKAIEKWIDENVFTMFSDREGFLSNLNRVDHREYTIEEKIFLKSFSGYGGLGKYGQEAHKMNYEFYTPKLLIEKMWALAYKHGFTSQGSVLEPAVGTGEFLQFATSSPEVHAYEINEYSAIITAILYPFARVKLMPFEKLFIEKNFTVKNKLEGLKKYDLVIGNPPYASFDRNISRYLTMGEKDFTGAKNYVDYFIRRGIDLVKPGGLLIYVVGAEVRMDGHLWLDEGDSPVKQYINSVADLVEAYRLPNEVFERTGVTSDIIVLKKR